MLVHTHLLDRGDVDMPIVNDTKLSVSYTNQFGNTVTVTITGMCEEDVPEILCSDQIIKGLGFLGHRGNSAGCSDDIPF